MGGSAGGDDTIRIFNNHLHSTAITVHDDKYLSEHQFLTDTAGGAKIKNIFRRFRDNSMLRAAQADTIARAIAATPGCKIVCGDFNDTPMSYAYRVMAQDLDDAFRASGKGYSYTFRGFMDVLRIDYVLYSEDLECLDYQVLYDVDLSDHYPVVVRLRPVKNSCCYDFGFIEKLGFLLRGRFPVEAGVGIPRSGRFEYS